MGPLFTSPMPPAGLGVRWDVSRRTNNALTALSKFNQADTTSHEAHCPTQEPSLDRCKWNVAPPYKARVDHTQRGQANGEFSRTTFFHSIYLCVYVFTQYLLAFVYKVWVYISGAVKSHSELLYRSVWFMSPAQVLRIMFPLETPDTVALFVI